MNERNNYDFYIQSCKKCTIDNTEFIVHYP